MKYDIVLSSDKKGFVKTEKSGLTLDEAKKYLENRENDFGNNYEFIYTSTSIYVICNDLKVYRDLKENFKIEIVEK